MGLFAANLDISMVGFNSTHAIHSIGYIPNLADHLLKDYLFIGRLCLVDATRTIRDFGCSFSSRYSSHRSLEFVRSQEWMPWACYH